MQGRVLGGVPVAGFSRDFGGSGRCHVLPRSQTPFYKPLSCQGTGPTSLEPPLPQRVTWHQR